MVFSLPLERYLRCVQGRLFVPITKKHLIIDLIQKLNLPVVLVSKHYLGSINHTLSSIFALQSRNIPIAGIIFNGDYVRSSQDFILEYSNINSLGNIPQMKPISKKSICLYAKMMRDLLIQYYFTKVDTSCVVSIWVPTRNNNNPSARLRLGGGD